VLLVPLVGFIAGAREVAPVTAVATLVVNRPAASFRHRRRVRCTCSNWFAKRLLRGMSEFYFRAIVVVVCMAVSGAIMIWQAQTLLGLMRD
jgi:hypothetical protein